MYKISYNIFSKNKLTQLKNILQNVFLFVLISISIHIISIGISIYLFSYIDETTDADVAVILGASVWGDKPSPVFQERINHGIWLYKTGYVKYLIFTGGFGKNSDVSESSIAKNYAINNSVPIDNIFIEEISRITLENIIYSKNIIKKYDFNKIIIVSDPLHMKRAITMAKDNGLNVYSSPTPTTRYISPKTKINFLLYEAFYYFCYEVYKYFPIVFLYLFLLVFLFLIYYLHIFRQNCT